MPCLEKMADFVLRANLPHAVRALIIGEKYMDILKAPLARRGITCIALPDNPCVDARLSGHADLSAFHAGGARLWLAPQLKGGAFAGALSALGADIKYADIAQGDVYPRDAQLNIAALGRAIIYNPAVAYMPIVESFTKGDACRAVICRQGYAKCSCVVVDEGAIITSDRGIARAAECAGLEVLLISPGHVTLDGFEYGFMGGAAFKLSDDVIAFTGRLDSHPDAERILAFLARRGISPVYLTDIPAFDIGGAIPLTEK